MKIEASFIRSAASASDLPRDRLAEIALVGRSNVGKSSLINALVRQRVARTSGAPGKTRLANVYRVTRGGRPPLYLLDLPGYGYARGGDAGFEALAATVFVRQTGRTAAGGRAAPGARCRSSGLELDADVGRRSRHRRDQDRQAVACRTAARDQSP